MQILILHINTIRYLKQTRRLLQKIDKISDLEGFYQREKKKQDTHYIQIRERLSRFWMFKLSKYGQMRMQIERYLFELYYQALMRRLVKESEERDKKRKRVMQKLMINKLKTQYYLDFIHVMERWKRENVLRRKQFSAKKLSKRFVIY